jgi:protein O-GlcNAcase/histone acetyltransferase
MIPDFISGVIEGFYGQPWSCAERLELFGWMRAWGLNTYFYAPKDDLKLRARWREPYAPEELNTLRASIDATIAHGIEFTYALSPGLDIRYSAASDLAAVQRRFQALIDLGARRFALLFDDIPAELHPDDAQSMDSLAELQANFANKIHHWLTNRNPACPFLFCPTPYCGRMADRGLGGPTYLAELGASLHPNIQVFWTGPEIISEEISTSHLRQIAALLRRKPILWDNLHANDYDGRRVFVGPYSGRPRELREEVAGILINPNCEFSLNFVPSRTFAQFLKAPGAWDAREAYLSALREWLPQFDNISLDDLTLLCDCFYLPHQDGPEAESLFESLRHVVERPQDTSAFPALLQRAQRLRGICSRVADIKNRPLFYALSRRIWELREELDLLEKFVAFRGNPDNNGKSFRSDFHLPKTYRGGFVPRLQKLLAQNPDGTFTPNKIDE